MVNSMQHEMDVSKDFIVHHEVLGVEHPAVERVL